jgi:anti-anti-sigma factor
MTQMAPGSPPFCLTVTCAEGQTVLAVAGELDLATVGEFAAQMADQLAKGPTTLDLHELSFMDSSGVRAIDGLLRDVAREGWSFAIRDDLQSSVRKVFELTGMLAALPLVADARAPESR